MPATSARDVRRSDLPRAVHDGLFVLDLKSGIRASHSENSLISSLAARPGNGAVRHQSCIRHPRA
jgi:hypothetical protein